MKILVASDGSAPCARACQLACRLLPREPHEIRILTVLSLALDRHTAMGWPLADDHERVERIKEEVERATREPEAILRSIVDRVELVDRFGYPADEILDEIEEWKPDLVILGKRGLSTAARWFMGSVSDRVIRHSKVPVLVHP